MLHHIIVQYLASSFVSVHNFKFLMSLIITLHLVIQQSILLIKTNPLTYSTARFQDFCNVDGLCLFEVDSFTWLKFSSTADTFVLLFFEDIFYFSIYLLMRKQIVCIIKIEAF